MPRAADAHIRDATRPTRSCRLGTTVGQVRGAGGLLPEPLQALPAELAAVDALLDDAAFFAPYRAHFDAVIGRPSTPIETCG